MGWPAGFSKVGVLIGPFREPALPMQEPGSRERKSESACANRGLGPLWFNDSAPVGDRAASTAALCLYHPGDSERRQGEVEELD